MSAVKNNNEIGLDGIEFIEFSSTTPGHLSDLFESFGFSKIMKHKTQEVDLYRQGEINLLVNQKQGSFAEDFQKKHGPCASSMAWKFHDVEKAYKLALERGAEAVEGGDYQRKGQNLRAIKGIGESLIYFVESNSSSGLYSDMGFTEVENPKKVKELGFLVIDHLTNNVPKGEMETWSNFYKNIFGFTEVRYFDIRGAQTGLVSYALRSPCGKFCIPINEGTEEKSQINEYLREYKGAGVQHIAFTTDDIVNTVRALNKTQVSTLDIDEEYYNEVFERVPNVTESYKDLADLNILVDGDEKGYLLQIFTKNVIGPIFIEIIQRKNNLSFGEGNFGALFRSIERDQEKRGVL